MSPIAVASIILFAALLIALVIVDERRARHRSTGRPRQPIAVPRFEPGWTQIHDKRNGYNYGREMLGSDACPAPEDVRTLEQEGVAWRPWTGG